MPITPPKTLRQLGWILAKRLGLAAILIGFMAGGAAYLIETRQAERAAVERVVEGARHFELPAMKVAMAVIAPEEHGALDRMLDRSRFVGMRVFGADGALVDETWQDIPAALVKAARAHQPDWPATGHRHQGWINVAEERLIQVGLPLVGKDGQLAGYLEGVSRLDEPSMRAQREQVRNGVLTAVFSVLVTACLLYPLLLTMLRRSTELSRRLLESNLSLMHALGKAIAKRDSDTDAHSYRVTFYAVALAETMGLPKQQISELIVGAFLHDVGKIGIPDHILRKPGKLTIDEFVVMKTHALLGAEIVAGNPWLEGAALTIRHHHERFDGAGYPDGLTGEEIPHAARIFAVVDVFDALTSARPYKKSLALAEALNVIDLGSGRHFAPEVVAAFKQIAPGLYANTRQAGDMELRQGMAEVLSRYFSSTAG